MQSILALRFRQTRNSALYLANGNHAQKKALVFLGRIHPDKGVHLAIAVARLSGLPLVIAAPVLALTLSLPTPAYPWLIASLAAGTPGLSFLGAIGAALTVGIRRGGLLLSILVLPLYIPTLIFGARAVTAAAEGSDPWSAFLMLAGPSPDEAFLTAGEVQQMRLQASLVVLSACQSGLGFAHDGGVIGLARAFQ